MGGDENTNDASSSKPAAATKATGDKIDEQVFDQMLDILKDLTNHTHIFYDDYTTACNCNCNCTCCVRGMVW